MARQEGVLNVHLVVPGPSTRRHRALMQKIRVSVLKILDEPMPIKILPVINEYLRVDPPRNLIFKWSVVPITKKKGKWNEVHVTI